MAYPNQINVPRIDRLLRHLLNMKEQTIAPSISPDVQTNLILENDRPEFGFLSRTKLGGGTASMGAVVGERQHILLVNPVRSQQLVVVTRVDSSAVSDVIIGWHQNRGPSVDAAAAFIRDTRWDDGTGSSTRTTAQIHTLSQVGILNASQHFTLDLGGFGQHVFEVPIVLQEEHVLFVAPSTDNLNVRAAFQWYERPAEPLERGLFARQPV